MQNEMLQVRMEVNPKRVVPCLTAIRRACGCGLREAKDTYYAILNGGGRKIVRLTFAEFGRLVAANALDSEWLFSYNEIEIIRPDDNQFIELVKASALAG